MSKKAENVSLEIVHYCKDCEKMVKGKQIGKKYAFTCPHCGSKHVSFGTEKSIRNYYHIED